MGGVRAPDAAGYHPWACRMEPDKARKAHGMSQVHVAGTHRQPLAVVPQSQPAEGTIVNPAAENDLDYRQMPLLWQVLCAMDEIVTLACTHYIERACNTYAMLLFRLFEVCGVPAQVLCRMDEKSAKSVTLASMHSISKGFYGECGRRGGYLELLNVAPEVVSEFYKVASINLCSNVNGQICMALVMNPPKVQYPRCCLSCCLENLCATSTDMLIFHLS